MKEKPILFTGEMVRAILEGRKTQTRRVLKGWLQEYDGNDFIETDKGHQPILDFAPYRAGDRLWVKEPWRTVRGLDHFKPSEIAARSVVQYESGGLNFGGSAGTWLANAGRYRHARFMPRWASRLVLEVTSVRVERLQEINCGDCYAEGAPFPSIADTIGQLNQVARVSQTADWYRDLWDSLNAKRGHSWESNPWVWVVEFKRLEKETKNES